MRSFLTRVLALALALVFAVGMRPAAYADEDVRIRDTAYSETLGLRAAMSGKVSDTANFAVYGPDGELNITEVIEGEKNIYTIVTAEPLDVTAPYTLTYGADGREVRMPVWYSTTDFESRYTYTGDDLGATWTAESTTFKVWAPTAVSVRVNLYESGTEGTDDLIESIEMTAEEQGVWAAAVEGDLNGT